jgi:predicted ATP-dependent endonuclease of OLD family
MNIDVIGQYGALSHGFNFTLPDVGYVAITGPNNSGKSSILQYIFKDLFVRNVAPFDQSSNVIIFTERIHVLPDTQPSTESLAYYNNAVYQQINTAILNHDDSKLASNRLPRLLLNHSSLLDQVSELNKMLERLQLPTFKLSGSQNIVFEDIAIQVQGSGLRSLFYILSALTDDKLHCILIDEPELALEPRLQRVLRDLLEEKAKDKLIIVATHSNLFLNRTVVTNNYKTSFNPGTRSSNISQLTDEQELYDITFNLLGSSLVDLYFPENYLIVEGTSDQIICERLQELLNINKNRIKVLSASGIDNIKNTYRSVVNSLKPLVINGSPYAKKIVALVDATDKSSSNYIEIKKTLNSRLYTLPNDSLEEYLSEEFYELAGRNKDEDLAKIAQLKSDHLQLGQFKKEISNAIAPILTEANISSLQVMIDALKKAS